MMQLYIDPATGSMLFSIIDGIFLAAAFFVRMLFVKIKFLVSGGRGVKNDKKNRIPYLIYSDDKRYANVFVPILNEFEKRGTDVTFWTSSVDDPILAMDYRHVHAEYIGKGNKGIVKLNSAAAGVFLATTPGLDVLQWKRSRNVDCYVHVLHAADTCAGYRMFGLDFYDAVLVSGSVHVDEIRLLEQKRNLAPKDVRVVGLTYFDTVYERLAGTVRPDNTKPVILLAPSWGPSGLLHRYGSRIIDSLVATGYRIVFRPHPQSYTADKEIIDELRRKYPESDDFEWNSDNDNFDVLNRADLLVTDFSGIIFDFTLLFGKPVMYTSPDFDNGVYDAAWIEEPLWKFKVLPSIGCEIDEKDFEDMKARIDSVIEGGDYREGIQKAGELAWQNRGHAAESIVQYMIDAGQRKTTKG